MLAMAASYHTCQSRTNAYSGLDTAEPLVLVMRCLFPQHIPAALPLQVAEFVSFKERLAASHALHVVRAEEAIRKLRLLASSPVSPHTLVKAARHLEVGGLPTARLLTGGLSHRPCLPCINGFLAPRKLHRCISNARRSRHLPCRHASASTRTWAHGQPGSRPVRPPPPNLGRHWLCDPVGCGGERHRLPPGPPVPRLRPGGAPRGPS